MVTNKELYYSFLVNLTNLVNLENIIRDLMKVILRIGNNEIRKTIKERLDIIIKIKNEIEEKTTAIFLELKRRKVTIEELKEIEI